MGDNLTRCPECGGPATATIHASELERGAHEVTCSYVYAHAPDPALTELLAAATLVVAETGWQQLVNDRGLVADISSLAQLREAVLGARAAGEGR